MPQKEIERAVHPGLDTVQARFFICAPQRFSLVLNIIGRDSHDYKSSTPKLQTHSELQNVKLYPH